MRLYSDVTQKDESKNVVACGERLACLMLEALLYRFV
jgi:hypothetical protein